jgi:hypothetical protein
MDSARNGSLKKAKVVGGWWLVVGEMHVFHQPPTTSY